MQDYLADAAQRLDTIQKTLDAQYENKNPSKADPQRIGLELQVNQQRIMLAALGAGMNPLQATTMFPG